MKIYLKNAQTKWWGHAKEDWDNNWRKNVDRKSRDWKMDSNSFTASNEVARYVPTTDQRQLTFSEETEFEEALNSLLERSSGLLPIVVIKDGNNPPGEGRRTAWEPKPGHVLSTYTNPNPQITAGWETMMLIEALVLGGKAGDGFEGRVLVAMQMKYPSDKDHIINMSEEVRVIIDDFFVYPEQKLEITMQVRRNIGGREEFVNMPYLYVHVEHHRDFTVPWTFAYHKQFWSPVMKDLNSLMRQLAGPAFWDENDLHVIKHSHFERVASDSPLEVARMIYEMPVQTILHQLKLKPEPPEVLAAIHARSEARKLTGAGLAVGRKKREAGSGATHAGETLADKKRRL